MLLGRVKLDIKIAELVHVIHEHCDFVQRARPLEDILSQKEILQKFMLQIIECAEFIWNYGSDKSFGGYQFSFTLVDCC